MQVSVKNTDFLASKFNSSLKMKNNEDILDDHVKWEYLKYNIRKYTINFSKKTSKNTNKKMVT